MAKRYLTLKLLVDEDRQRVLYAEAGKDVVDFLFSLLALPVGTTAGFLAAERMVGSLGKLYNSVERMDGNYIREGFDKSVLLRPTVPSHAACRGTLPLESSQPPPPTKFYGCYNSYNDRRCGAQMTDAMGVRCPICSNPMQVQMTHVPSKQVIVAAGDGGYVKGVATYMVMDDLAVEPMSTISCVTLFNRFRVRDVGSLRELTVQLGPEEGLRLLKASMHSKTVLTDTFLRTEANKESPGPRGFPSRAPRRALPPAPTKPERQPARLSRMA